MIIFVKLGSAVIFPEIKPPSTQQLLPEFSEFQENPVATEAQAHRCEQSQVLIYLNLNTERVAFHFAVIVTHTKYLSFHAAWVR